MSLSQAQTAVLSLWHEVNTSLVAYQRLLSHFGSALEAMQASSSDWQQLGVHQTHVARHRDSANTEAMLDQVHTALDAKQYQVLWQEDDAYPSSLLQLYDPPPLLFCRGQIARLQHPQIAMVGSRNPSPQAQKITFDMAQYLVQAGYVVTSGLAFGVDKQAHLGALAQTDPALSGMTVGVMGTGIDVCYPRQNQALYEQILQTGGCLVSELMPTTPANKHTFPRRNRLVAGLSLGTIVTEAAMQSGSLITARLTSEQGKQVFAVPSHIDNGNAEGCHHLIREGATLIYHPEQVIEDLSTQHHSLKQLSPKASEPPNVPTRSGQSSIASAQTLSHVQLPEQLQGLYQCIDWAGQDLDTLIDKTGKETASLLSELMQLELLGVIQQQAGRYVRV